MTNVTKLGRHVPVRIVQQLMQINDTLHDAALDLPPSPARDNLLSRAEVMRGKLEANLQRSLRLEGGYAKKSPP